MDTKVEWMEILMILGASAGGILSSLLFIFSKNPLSLWLFVVGVSGGAILGLIFNRYTNYKI